MPLYYYVLYRLRVKMAVRYRIIGLDSAILLSYRDMF